MATLLQATSSGTDAHQAQSNSTSAYTSTSTRQRAPNVEANGNALTQTNGSTHKRARSKDSKYRHVFATHSESRTTCLSHESKDMPSFVGFRNLMILVLSTYLPIHQPIKEPC